MQYQKTGLGPIEAQFLAYTQAEDRRRICTGDLQAVMGLTPIQERKLLSRLALAGMIVRLKRGVYLVPEKLPPGGKWRPSEYKLVSQIMEVYGARYYISGPSAFNYYGLVPQIPNEITVYNDKLSSQKNIGGQIVNLIKTATKRIAGWRELELPDSEGVKIATLSRTIVDGIYDWKRFNSLPMAFDWLRNAILEPSGLEELTTLTRRYTNSATRRRVGYILEMEKVNQKYIKSLKRSVRKTKSTIPLDPSKPKNGKLIERWGIIDNG